MAGAASVPATASNTVPNTPAFPNPLEIPINPGNGAGARFLRRAGQGDSVAVVRVPLRRGGELARARQRAEVVVDPLVAQLAR